MAAATQAPFSIRVKTILVRRQSFLAALGRRLRPPHPRSTVSQAIHTNRFPRVRRQVKEALGL